MAGRHGRCFADFPPNLADGKSDQADLRRRELAGLIYLLPLYLALRSPGRAYTRHAIAIGQMLTPALFIHLTGGRF